MTIGKAIDRADRERPNGYTLSEKIEWLSELDAQVYREVLLMAEENWKYREITEEITDPEGNVIETKTYTDYDTQVPAIEFAGYDTETPLDTEMLIDDAYGKAYVKWLIMNYDDVGRNSEDYNNSVMSFNSVYNSYIADYRRNHMPRTRKVRGI